MLCLSKSSAHNKAVKHRQQAGWTSLRSAAYGRRYVANTNPREEDKINE